GRRCNRGLVLGYRLQKCRRWREEQVSRNCLAEVEQPVVVAGRPANKHILEHLLNSARRTAVPNEIGAKFTVRGPAKWHVIAQDLDLVTVLDDRRESVMR